jgi:hypothetical protein
MAGVNKITPGRFAAPQSVMDVPKFVISSNARPKKSPREAGFLSCKSTV